MNQTLPEWYRQPSAGGSGDESPHSKWVRKALAGLAEAMARDLVTAPRGSSWMRRVEPRARIVGVFALIIGTTLVHDLWVLTVLFGVSLALAASVRLPARRLGRFWLGVPLFSLAIVLPAITSFVTPGEPVLRLWSLGSETLSVTSAGLLVAGRFLLRSTTCITLCCVLVSTTEPAALLCSLRRLGMPRVFGMVLTMAHRYLGLMLRAAEEIHLAKLSRTISARRVRDEQRWAAAGIAVLFRKTHKLAQEVHNAMLARGYDGDLESLRR